MIRYKYVYLRNTLHYINTLRTFEGSIFLVGVFLRCSQYYVSCFRVVGRRGGGGGGGAGDRMRGDICLQSEVK